MKPKKDIFDLFKDNEHKLSESPSRQAWDRLDRRLDSHKDRNRTSIYRILSMAAAVVVLVAFISVISFNLNFNQQPEHLSAENMSTNFTTQELIVVNVANENNDKIATYQRKYDHHLSSPILEGKANKKLIARMDPQRRDGNLDSFVKRAKKEKERPLAIVSAPAGNSALKLQSAAKMESLTLSYSLENDDGAYTDSLVPSVEIAGNFAKPESKDLADEVGAFSEMEEVVVFDNEPASKKKADRYAYEPAAGAADQTKEIRNEAKTSSAAGIANGKNTGIQQFQWLTGKWEGNVNNQVSVEQWKQVDDKTLEGRGYLVVNGQSDFNEDMKIQEKKGVIYFIADLNGTGKKIRYKLVSNDGFEAVFENKKIDFPNQVVLQRTNSSNFQTIYQNTSPGNIDETQQSYYLNRNYIQKEQVIRNLRRVND